MDNSNYGNELESGEKNIVPRNESNNWMNVDYFLHTWGFLPNDTTAINKLKDSEKTYLILLLLDFSWRRFDGDTSEKLISMVQEFLLKSDESFGDYFKEFEQREKEFEESRIKNKKQISECEKIIQKCLSRQTRRAMERELDKIGEEQFLKKHSK